MIIHVENQRSTDVCGWKQQKGKNHIKDRGQKKIADNERTFITKEACCKGKKLKAVPRRKGNFNHIKARLFYFDLINSSVPADLSS